MSDTENYADLLNREDTIDFFEDTVQEQLEGDTIAAENLEVITQDTPVYMLCLEYSKETFNAAWSGEPLQAGQTVLVPTRYGRDLAKVLGIIQKKNDQISQTVVRVERIATEDDLYLAESYKNQEKEAFDICMEKIKVHRLDMKLISVHYLLEDAKILFFFTAESRIDFRELVKDLVNIFKIRVELRQIGVRDEARVVGGLGVCGRGFCCHTVSDKLKPVSIKMAKEQNLSLNSIKISGHCGRLLCCLAYEHLFYTEQNRLVPPEGLKISWEGTLWKVAEVNVVSGKVKLVAEDERTIQLPVPAFEKVDGRWFIRKAPCREQE